jgi:putative ABC transport system permease protein
MTPLRPYLAPLRRQRLMPLLVIAQTALACAILANVLFLLWQKLGPMLVPDGVPRGELVLVDQLVSGKGSWNAAQVRAGTDALRTIPGVTAVSPAIGMPMSSTLTMTGRVTGPAATETVSLFTGDTLLQTLGLQLSSGRDFSADERIDIDLAAPGPDGGATEPVILTDALARRLFGEHPALGGVLTGKDPKDPARFVVVGTVKHLLRYQIDELDDGKAEFSMLTAGKVTGVPILTYVVRAAPEQRQAVIAEIPKRLKRILGSDMMAGIDIRVGDYESQRDARLKPRRAAVWLFGTVSAVVTTITLIGIASLSGFWIQQRTRQIGIRRALGATRGQVRRHFQIENLLVTGSGVALGMPLAYAANLWLLQHYELPRLPAFYLPIGLVALLLLGQLAVFAPARRAASVPPAVATRSA